MVVLGYSPYATSISGRYAKQQRLVKLVIEEWIGCEGTNITGERVVNHRRRQLNDALIES